jgi:hypothetical protein
MRRSAPSSWSTFPRPPHQPSEGRRPSGPPLAFSADALASAVGAPLRRFAKSFREAFRLLGRILPAHDPQEAERRPSPSAPVHGGRASRHHGLRRGARSIAPARAGQVGPPVIRTRPAARARRDARHHNVPDDLYNSELFNSGRLILGTQRVPACSVQSMGSKELQPGRKLRGNRNCGNNGGNSSESA